MLNKILIPMDGSDCSKRAAAFAAELVQLNSGVEVIVLTVHRMPYRHLEKDLYWAASSKNEHAEHIEKVFEDLRKFIMEDAVSIFKESGIDIKFKYATGNPAEKICAYAGNNGVDLIVMGSHGMSVVQGIFMGSVSHKVLQMSSCPVTLVK